MRYSRDAGWHVAVDRRPVASHRVARALSVASISISAIVPPQAFAAKQSIGSLAGADRPLSSMAAAEMETSDRRGTQCLANLDGSNESAVEQIKAAMGKSRIFVHLETQLAPLENGRHGQHRAREPVLSGRVAGGSIASEYVACVDNA